MKPGTGWCQLQTKILLRGPMHRPDGMSAHRRLRHRIPRAFSSAAPRAHWRTTESPRPTYVTGSGQLGDAAEMWPEFAQALLVNLGEYATITELLTRWRCGEPPEYVATLGSPITSWVSTTRPSGTSDCFSLT